MLVYAVDPRDARKQDQALGTLREIGTAHAGLLSAQILGEFFTAVTRRLPSRLTTAEAERLVVDYARSWSVVGLDSEVVMKAISGLRRYQLPYWDALIWATALIHGVPCVLSEDFNDGAILEGVRFLNPFRQGFDLGRLL